MTPSRPVHIRLVPAPAGHDMRPALEVLARAAGYSDLDALRAASLARKTAAPTAAVPT